jgi:hypothetical protein
MRRREVLALLSGGIVWPLVARAQQERIRRLSVLTQFAEDDQEASQYIAMFRRGLRLLAGVKSCRCNRLGSISRVRSASLWEKHVRFIEQELGLTSSKPALSAGRSGMPPARLQAHAERFACCARLRRRN